MIGGLRAVAGPLLSVVEARFKLAAAAAIRRAVLMIAATLFGVGALLFLSIGVFFALLPGVGAAGAAFVMALIWALLAALCYVLSLLRPRRVRAVALPPPVVAPPPPPPPYGTAVPPYGVPPYGVPPAPRPDVAAQIRRAAPVMALAALVAGIVAGRR